MKADLSLLREAERVAKGLPADQLDLVVFTTGIFAALKRQETAERLERDMAGGPKLPSTAEEHSDSLPAIPVRR